MNSPYTRNGIFELSSKLFLGTFPNDKRCELLRGLGITHIINVDRPYDNSMRTALSFAKLREVPLVDGRRIPFDEARPAVEAIHAALSEDSSRVYVHCFICCNRSPAVAWFYLVAAGMDPVAASEFIYERAPQASSGHAEFYGSAVIAEWQGLGSTWINRNIWR